MTGWLEIASVAFVAQLAALPGVSLDALTAALFLFFGADTVLQLLTGVPVWETLVGTGGWFLLEAARTLL